MISKWIIYQKERFPLLKYGLLVAAFTYSALSVSLMLRGGDGLPDWKAFLTAFPASLLLFSQLRVADEFKDNEEDSLYQPHRPVPRGLISLNELLFFGIAGAFIQLSLTFSYHVSLLIPLGLTWLYFLLMSQEFFVRDWLRRRPFTYLWTHMLILLFVDLYVTAFDWLVAGSAAPPALMLFLAVSFFNGTVIEIGRKIKAPSDEIEGVQSYSSSWGLKGALVAWLAALALSALFALLTAWSLQFALPMAAAVIVLSCLAVNLVIKFASSPTRKSAEAIESYSGIWTVLMYLLLGAIPCALRAVTF